MSRIFTVTLPDIGEGVVEGEVVEWLKHVNDSIKQDEAVVVVMTDKATVELPSPYPGTLAKIYYKEGEIAIKGKPLYDIQIADDIVLHEKAQQREEKVSEKKESQPVIRMTACEGKAAALPAIRQLSKELGVDINQIQGTGKDGRVTKEDLQRHCSASHQEKASPIPRFEDDVVEPIIGIPRLMFDHMSTSKREAAHFSYFEQVDATRLVAMRLKFKEEAKKEGVTITYMPFLIKALSMSLKDFPKINSTIDKDSYELIVHKQHNIGIAVATDLGLIVPVLRDVQDMTIHEIIMSYNALMQKAVNKRLHADDMKGSTTTISNFGVLGGGGCWATPVINYPEVAILAISRVQKVPMVKNSEVVAREALNLSWSFDHRIIDGNMAATFSHHFAMLLQNPAPLL